MGKQLDIFEQEKSSKYKIYYDNFYRGVSERFEKENYELKVRKYENISISIKLKENETIRRD